MGTPENEAGRALAHRPETGLAFQSGPSILGERPARLPVAGKIRAGIKRLTQKWAANKEASAIYDAGEAAGKTWDAIEREIRQALKLGDKEHPLVPQNTPYFHVCRADFKVPEIADRLLELYGEAREDGVRRLYRLPVVFLTDDWLSVLPHSFTTYRGGNLVFWSEYGADGVRYCKTYGSAGYDERAQRHVRNWGGRPVVLRAENDGLCQPSACQEYQRGECKMKGELTFAVPNIPGGAIAMRTGSFYGLEEMRAQLGMMLHARGRLSRTFNGEPMFMLMKQERMVKRLENGVSKSVRQIIPTLETTAELVTLLGHYDEPPDDDDVPAAIAMLEGAPPAGQEAHEEPAPPSADDDIVDGEIVEDEPAVARGHDAAQQSGRDVVTDLRTGQDPELESAISDAKKLMGDHLRRLQIPFKEFGPYAANAWGDNWLSTLDALNAACAEMLAIGNDKAKDYRRRVIERTPF